VSQHCVSICLKLVEVNVELSSSWVVGAGQRETAEHVGVDILGARPMLNLEIKFLDHEHPAGRLTLEVGSGKQPLQRLVIGDEGEGGTVEVVAEAADGPDGCTELSVVTSI
jgi:hypothetical protein